MSILLPTEMNWVGAIGRPSSAFALGWVCQDSEMTGSPTIDRLLDELEEDIPGMIERHVLPSDFWTEFVAGADSISRIAKGHETYVRERVDRMLASHGRYLFAVPMDRL